MSDLSKIKGRAWAFVMYPESMPEDWVDIIQRTGLPMAISPLHDMDVNPTGDPKKEHYHVICYYDNPTTCNNVYENVCKKLNATIPIKLESIRGMYRYHIHIDNPEKYQYNDIDRQFFNGFDVGQVNSLTKTEELKVLRNILSFIRVNDITEYKELLETLDDNDLIDMLEISMRSCNAFVLNTYICSRRNDKIKKC